MDWIKRHEKASIAIGLILVITIFGGILGAVKDQTKPIDSTQKAATTETPKTQPVTQPTPTASPTKSKFQQLKDIAGIDATLLVANSSELKEASSESEAPFKVLINSSNVIECSSAKTASYNVIKSLYSDNNLKGLVDQVIVTYPNRLVTSLSGDDGRSTSSWSGETNFYKVMFDNFQVSQRDPDGQKTWVVSINSCK